MLYPVKIEPSLFLLALTPVEPGVIKVSLEVPAGRFSFEGKRTAGDRAGEPRWTCIGRVRGWGIPRSWGGIRCSWESFALGGGNLSGYGTLGKDFVGVARHD